MESVINDRLVKLEDDGELYWWKTHNKGVEMKNPQWMIFKPSLCGTKKYRYKKIIILKKTYKLHRVIYKLHNPEWNIDDTSKYNVIDHIDRNTENNNIQNLRAVTQHQNIWNMNSKGYSWDKKANKYRVRIILNGESINGGYFVNEEDAITKRAELKLKYHQIN